MCLWNRWKISPALIVFLQWGFWSRRMSALIWPCGQHSQGLLWLIVWLSKPWLTFTLDKCHQTQKQELSWQSMSTEKMSSSLQSLECFYYEQISEMSVIHLFQCWILDKSFKRSKYMILSSPCSVLNTIYGRIILPCRICGDLSTQVFVWVRTRPLWLVVAFVRPKQFWLIQMCWEHRGVLAFGQVLTSVALLDSACILK